jgi:hypothetical protein
MQQHHQPAEPFASTAWLSTRQDRGGRPQGMLFFDFFNFFRALALNFSL